MKSELILPFLLRFLPPLMVLALGFYAASDKNSRQRWTQLLYQAGSLRPEQRDDPKAQQSVRVPFFVLAALMLFLPAKLGPVSYFMWATHKIEVKMDFTRNKEMASREAPSQEVVADVAPTPTAIPAALNPPMPPQPGSPAGQPASPAAPGNSASPGAPAPRNAPELGLQGLRKK